MRQDLELQYRVVADVERIQEHAPKRLRNSGEHEAAVIFHNLQAAMVTVVVPVCS